MKFFFYVAPSFTKSFLALIFIALSANLFAQQASLSVQGVLTKADGTAVEDDVYTLTFRLWNHPDATGGANKKHEETINNVETVGGVYTVIMGINGTPLAASFDEVYYLGVSMNTSNVELLPRPRLTHAPYALGIKGQNNTFPSTGAVIGDAFRAKGGPASGGIGGNGFAFQAPSGDDNGGLFSDGPNNISIYAGGSQKAKFTNGLNELLGPTNTNDLRVFGTLTSDNINPHGANGTVNIGGSVNVNGNETVTGNAQINGSTNTIGNTITGDYFYTNRKQDGGGYTFIGDGGNDSGLFGFADGDIALYANDVEKIRLYPNHLELKGGNIEIHNRLFMFDVPDFNGKNMQWDPTSKQVGADNSSRRFKQEIETLHEDWSLILKSRPVTYTRKSNPNQREIGYIAEEMDSIGLKRLVEHDGNGVIDGFDYERMILYVTEVVKMQHADIEILQAEVAALKTENAGLSTDNTNLKTTNSNLQSEQAAFNTQLEALSKRMNSLENTRAVNNRK